MYRENYMHKIEDRIRASEKGTIFITADFFDISKTDPVNKALSRLMKTGLIRKIMRGIYEYPEFNDFLKEYIAPSPDKIAHALARNYGWTIVPCGDTALNLLGLSVQVPAVWSYVSDGAYKEYEYNTIKISFRKTANKEISKINYKTALLIQGLKALGKENIDDKTIKKISGFLNDKEKIIMLEEAKYATAWIYDVIKDICK